MGLFNRNPAPEPVATPNDAASLLEKATNGAAAAVETVSRPLKAPSRPSIVPVAPPSERQIYMSQLKVRIHQQLVERLDLQGLRSMPPEAVRQEVRALIRELCQNEKGL